MIFRPSGGMLYHWRAWRQRHQWQDFARQIATWLSAWTPPTETLVLIGPSAGYTLPTEWLKRFKRIEAYDLDPLAPVFFRCVHPSLPIHFHRRNLFWQKGRLTLQPLEHLRTLYPRATFLFSNILGQVLLEGQAHEAEWAKFLLDLRERMRGTHWASYHDLFTHEGREVIDHLMQGEWNHGLPTQRFRWQLTRRSLHVIEGVTYSPPL